MNDLSPESRALLGAVRDRESPEEGPSERDRARLRASLALHLGSGVFAITTSSAAAAVQAPVSTAGEAVASASLPAAATTVSAATIPSRVATLSASSASAGSAAGIGVGRIALCLLVGAAAGGALLVATAPLRSPPAPIASGIGNGVLAARAPRAKAEESAPPHGATDPHAHSAFDPPPTVAPVIAEPEATQGVRESSSDRPVPQDSARSRRGRDTEPDRAPLAPTARSQSPSERPVQGSASFGAFPVEGAAGAASTLAEEVSLLRSAEEKIRNGDPAMALDILRSHEHRFLHGSLEIERRAARIVALCQASRGEEGRLEAAAFTRDYPDSPLLDRLTQACGER
jgi:hypothetical protein